MTTQLLLVAPFAAPLAAAGVAAVVRGHRTLQRILSAAAVLTVVASGVAITLRRGDAPVLHTVIGGEEALVGVALTADPLGAGLVAAVGLLTAMVVATLAATGGDTHPALHPLILVMLAGASGSFLAGDLFNIFVFFEVVLIASYVLLVRPGEARQLRAAAVYVAVNILGTLLLLSGIAAVYGTAGTVNLALLAEQSTGGGVSPGAALVVVAFTVKAGLLPFSAWLVAGYPAAERTTLALFAGTLTTVGVAAIYRVVLLSFAGSAALRTGVLVAAVATLLVGSLAATAAGDHGRVLALVVLVQVSFMALGFGLGTTAGVAAGVFFILQDTVVKAAVVLAHAGGMQPGQLSRRARWLVVGAFTLLALSLAGVPPLSGFVGKALIVEAAFGAGAGLVAAVAMAGSAATLAALLPLWRDLTGPPPRPSPGTRGAARTLPALPVAVAALAALAVGIVPGWLLSVADAAATTLLDPAAYVTEVTGP
jgi:multicomponent Na+:H+ antiporter subunit D